MCRNQQLSGLLVVKGVCKVPYGPRILQPFSGDVLQVGCAKVFFLDFSVLLESSSEFECLRHI